ATPTLPPNPRHKDLAVRPRRGSLSPAGRRLRPLPTTVRGLLMFTFSMRVGCLTLAGLSLLAGPAAAQDAPPTNTWTRLDHAAIEGRRWDVPVGYSPELKRFLVLGGRITYADAPKPRSYDQLALDLKAGRWENWFPRGKD